MKNLKTVILIFVMSIASSSVNAGDCSDIKGNIIGKLFCKGTGFAGIGSSSSSASSEQKVEEVGDDNEGGFKIWKKPKWMKKK